MSEQVRIYYVGGDNDHVDARLPGLVLNYGNAVDVVGEDLATELLRLRHFSVRIIPAQVVEDSNYEVIKPRTRKKAPGAAGMEPQAKETLDSEVDNDNTDG